MLPMGGQDRDLLRRLVASQRNVIKLDAPEKAAIANTFSEKMASSNLSSVTEEDSRKSWQTMERINMAISEVRLSTEGPIRLGGFQSFQGLLNGEMVVINGFNDIRKSGYKRAAISS